MKRKKELPISIQLQMRARHRFSIKHTNIGKENVEGDLQKLKNIMGKKETQYEISNFFQIN